MGIKSVNDILKTYVPECFQTIPLVMLHNHGVAIDASTFIYARMSIALGKVVMNMPDPLENIDRQAVIQGTLQLIVSFLIKMSEYGITLVWCWDGKPPKAKDARKAKKNEEMMEKLQKITNKREELLAVHPLARTPEQLKKYKQLLSNYCDVDREEMKYFRNFLHLLGFPCLQAEDEAERLCANLAREGLVAGVWSTDTDNYVHGTPMMITDFDGTDEQKQPLITVVYQPIIIAKLKAIWKLPDDAATIAKFKDMCIMLGCDYNIRMPGVGEKRVWALMEKYNSIEAIAKAEPHRPVNVLNYEECRRLFEPRPTKFKPGAKELEFDKVQFAKHSRDVARQYDISNAYNQLIACMQYVFPPKTVTFTEAKEPPKRSRLNVVKTSSNLQKSLDDVLPLPTENPPSKEPISGVQTPKVSRLKVVRSI